MKPTPPPNSSSPSPDNARLVRLAADPRASELPLCDKLQLVCSVLAAADPHGFATANNLTRPEGQALLLSDSEERLRASHAVPSVKPLFNCGYFIHTGLDRSAAALTVELLMKRLGYAPGTVNQVKAMVTASESAEPFEALLRRYS